MSYFDNSTLYCPPNSSPATYHSFMCKSKGDYNCLYGEKVLKTVDYDQLHWSVSQEKSTIHNKTHHISKLRSILSDTISQVTKDSTLLKGESVELMLEIELMKTENPTPSNSMVEVTIIKFNKKREGTENKKLTPTKNIQTAATNSCTSESASQKRRNWFQRVISRQNDQNQHLNQKANKYVTDSFSKKSGGSGFFLDQKLVNNNNTKSSNQDPRSNFIKVLPEKIPKGGDFRKGYRRVSPDKKTPRIPVEFQSPKIKKTVETNKKSVVKKISEIFIPKKKSNKNNAIRTALTELKNEVDNIKVLSGKENKKVKRAPVHNLGKLVGNILDDMMDPSNNKTKDDSLSLKYQHFFEPVSKSKIKETEINPDKKRTKILTRTNVVQSHSDTCCVHYNYDSSNLNIKNSNSVSDCRAQTDSNKQIKSSEKGDSSEITSINKFNNVNKNYKKSHKKHAKGDATTLSDNKVARKQLQKSNKIIGTKKSTIEWNGQTVEVDKEIKTKIEMLIVNELQNLALKEGMECDVIPLHSSESCNDQPIEEMSSFICQLDISDKKIKKISKSKQLSETKANANTKPSKVLKSNKNPSKSKLKHKIQPNGDLETTVLQPIKKDTHIIPLGENLKKPKGIGTEQTSSKGRTMSDIATSRKGLNNNDVKITYINMNWSTESTTLKFESPENSFSTRHDSKVECCKSQVFKFGEDNYIYQKAIYSGFIKRIDSNDSTWQNNRLEASEKACLEENVSKQLVSAINTNSNVRYSSATSNEYQSSIEIELDVKDLEQILNEAKLTEKADKVLVSAKCKRENKKQRAVTFTGKNSPSYTDQLLHRAVKKLEKHIRSKKKQ